MPFLSVTIVAQSVFELVEGGAADPGATKTAGAASSPSATAVPWSQFRGPGGSASASVAGFTGRLTEADRAWTADLPGKGHSSPVAWGDRIFVTAEDASQAGVRWVVALRAADGREEWRYEDRFETYPLHSFNSYAASTPVCDAERVYVSWLSGTRRIVLALDHQGKKTWSADLGFYREDHGSSASPILVGDLLIVPNDHAEGKDAGIFGIEAESGQKRWFTPTQPEKTSFSTPVLVTAADGSNQIVFSSQPTALFALDPATGKRLWSHEHKVDGARAVGSPVVGEGGVIFATTGQGGAGRGAVAVKPGSADGQVPPTLVWEASNRIPYVPSPVAVGTNLYFLNDGGILSCVRARDGEHLWDERGPGKAYSSLISVNGVLVAAARDGTLMTARAAESFEPLGTLSLGEECQTTPAVAGGRLIVRTNTKLHAIGSAPPPPKP